MVTVSGTVTDQDGNGIGGVVVRVINEVSESVVANGTTASDGTYSFSVGTDSYHVIFSYEDADGNLYNANSYPAIT